MPKITSAQMTKSELVQEVQRELDSSFALPVQIQPEEIERIIKQERIWFIENYRYAVEMQYYVIALAEFKKVEFTSNRTILMPPCVVSVNTVQEITGAGMLGTVDRDFADNKLIASEIYLSPFLGDGLTYRIAQYQFFDLSKAFFMDLIRYNYNRRTQKLKITGRNPQRDVFIETYVSIPDENLFEDYYFIRMITAKSKLAMARQLSFFDFNLMGGIKINVSDLRSEAENEITAIKQEIADQDSPDYFLVYH
jgi:hypothetical protein